MICMYCFNMNQKKLRDIKSKEPQTDHRPIQDSLVSEEVKVKKSALTEEPGDGKIVVVVVVVVLVLVVLVVFVVVYLFGLVGFNGKGPIF